MAFKPNRAFTICLHLQYSRFNIDVILLTGCETPRWALDTRRNSCRNWLRSPNSPHLPPDLRSVKWCWIWGENARLDFNYCSPSQNRLKRDWSSWEWTREQWTWPRWRDSSEDVPNSCSSYKYSVRELRDSIEMPCPEAIAWAKRIVFLFVQHPLAFAPLPLP